MFSPILTVIISIGSEKVSAATIASAVRVPVPRSFVPIRSSTDPSLLMLHMHWEA